VAASSAGDDAGRAALRSPSAVLSGIETFSMRPDKQQTIDIPVRIGLVGLGGHGRTMQHAAEVASTVQVVAVFDVDEDEARAAAVRFGCDAAASYEAMLARDDLEAVALETPNYLHRAQAEAAFAAGLHVCVAKPIANTVAEGLAMVEAAEAAGRILMVGHNMRLGRAARAARRTLDEGRLGQVVSFEAHFSADNTRRLPRDAWRLRPDQCPLLPVMQLGVHAIDLVHYLDSPIEEVYATARSVTTPSDVVDSVVALFRTERGVTGTLISHYCTPVTFDYRLAGTGGSLRCTPHRYWYRSADDTDMHGDGPAETHDFTPHQLESHVQEMDVFGAAVRTGTAPEIDGWVGLQALAVVEALQRSAETRNPQPVPSFVTRAT